MDKERAVKLLAEQLQSYRGKSYSDLKGMIGDLAAYEVPNPDGDEFQIEIEVRWDGKPNGDIRVLGAIDDGGWSVFSPLSDSFIMTPEGTFLGE